MGGKKTIVDVRVKDLEKWRYPSKHYVYVLEVTWSEGTKTVIYRRYSRFFEFQCKLLEKFPQESGNDDPAQRMIPFLPGKKLFSRTNVRKVAEKRKQPLDEYCRQLIRLPTKISDDPFVLDFFEVTEDDLNPVKDPQQVQPKGEGPVGNVISDPILLDRYVAVADYDKQETNQCSLEAGQVVEVVEKNQHGWWFVTCTDNFSEGWVPANYLEPTDKEREEEDGLNEVLSAAENHITTGAHTGQSSDEVSFEKGVVMKVLEKRLDGWWKVDYAGKVGFAPAIFLQRYDQEVDESKTTAIYMVPTLQDVVKQSVGGASSRGVEPTTKPRVSAMNEKPALPKQKSAESVTPPTRKESLAVSASPNVQKSMSSSVVQSAAMATALSVSAPSKPPTSPTRKSAKPQRPPQPFKQASHEEIYSTIKLPPPRKSSVKRKKVEPPRPKPQPKPLPKPSKPQEGGAAAPPIKHFYDEIDDLAPEYYRTVSEFKCQAGDGLSFSAGAVLELITRNSTGWWYVQLEEAEGWVPSSYLEKCDPPTSPPRLPSTEHQDNGFAAALNERITGENSPATAKKTDSHERDGTNKLLLAKSLLCNAREDPDGQTSKQEIGSRKDRPVLPRAETSTPKEPLSTPSTSTRREPPKAPGTETTSRKEPLVTHRTDTSTRKEPLITTRTETSTRKEPLVTPRTEMSTHKEPLVTPRTETSTRKEPLVTTRTEMSTRKEPLVTPRTETSTRKEPLVTHRTETSTRKEPLVTHRTETSTRKEPLVTPRTETSTRKEPFVTHRTETSTRKEPLVTHRTETSTRKEPFVTHRTETSTRKEPLVTHRTETSTRKEPLVTHRTETSTRKEPLVTHRTESSKRREPPSAPKTETTSRKEPLVNPKTDTSTHREPPYKTGPKHATVTLGSKPAVSNKPKPAPNPKPSPHSSTVTMPAQPVLSHPAKPQPHRPTVNSTAEPSTKVSAELAAIFAKRSGQVEKPESKVSVTSAPPKPTPVSKPTSGSGSKPSRPSARPTTSPASPGSKSPRRTPPQGGKSRQRPAKPPPPSMGKSSGGVTKKPPPPRPSAGPSVAKSDVWITVDSYSGEGMAFGKGDEVEVIEKADDWWYVTIKGVEGWVPSTYLERGGADTLAVKPSRPPPVAAVRSKLYIAVADYDGADPGCVWLSEGERVSVLEECDDGWWKVRRPSGEEGWAPATFLEPQK